MRIFHLEWAQVEISEAFGRAIRVRRAELGISQEALAHRAHMARSFVSGLERGEHQPSVTSVWRLAKALECKPSALWEIAERLFSQQAPCPAESDPAS